MAFKLGGKSGLPMKRSGFKMRKSPFQRNMGIGVSPVKNLGIKPVFDDGTVGDNVSSAEAKRMLKSGEIQEIIKTGDDAIVGNIEEQKDLVEEGNSYATNAETEVDDYAERGLSDTDGDGDLRFGGRELHEETGGKTDASNLGTHAATDYDNYVAQYGQELVDADKQIQDYLNTNGSADGMPDHLVEAQAKIKEMDQKLFDRQKGKSEGDLRYGNSSYGETVEGEEGFEYPLRREALGVVDANYSDNTTRNFQDVEVASGGDGTDLTSQESGTKEAAEKERLRLEREAEIKAEEKAASKAASQLELDNMREKRSNEKAANEAQYADYKDTEPDYDPTSKRSRKKYKEWTDNAPDGFFDSYQ